tara:strand:+ start:437 stop:1504 length:1068 start_codon:yes stop_codon:yes gene_type:complete
MKTNILITTGGSGGHVVPAEILNDHLKDQFNVFTSTDHRGLKYFNKDKSNLIILDTPRLNLNLLIFFKIFKIFYLVLKSYFFLKKNKIKKVFSTGGYMSLPICISAKLLKLEIYLLEPNLILGRANRFFLNFCNKIFLYTKELKNFPQKFEHKIRIITPLVRKKFYDDKLQKKNSDKFCILVVGGSQGAKIFEDMIYNVMIKLPKADEIKIIQQTQFNNIENLKKNYDHMKIENYIFDFDDNFNDLIFQSDLCITRAGASTLAELSKMNKPFLAVPLATAKDNHQFENARYYEKLNCCWIMSQKNFNSDNLEKFLKNILNDKSSYNIKKDNLKKLNFQNSWNNVNQKLLNIINEN